MNEVAVCGNNQEVDQIYHVLYDSNLSVEVEADSIHVAADDNDNKQVVVEHYM